MEFIRRGNIKFPHKGSACITLHRLDGTPIFLRLSDINCWEEFRSTQDSSRQCLVFHFLSSTAVRETFDECSAIINGLEVAP